MTDEEQAQAEVERRREERDETVARTLREVRAQVVTLVAVTSTLASLVDELFSDDEETTGDGS